MGADDSGMKLYKEVKIDLCSEHKEVDLTGFYPGYIFNPIILFPPRKCSMKNCQKEAYYTSVGVRVPDTVGTIERSEDEKLCRATYEIYREAKSLLDGGKAIDMLQYYIWCRIVPSSHREFIAQKMVYIFAGLVLAKLNIDPECSLSDTDKHRILKLLEIYPEEYE